MKQILFTLSMWLLALLGFVPISAQAQTGSIRGTIFEDPNYGGGAGRPLVGTTGSTAVGTAGNAATAATVELYTSAGDYVATTTTSTTAGTLGQYTFANQNAGSYIVRTVNATVRSTRPGTTAGLLPVQTFRTNNGANDLNRVGGEAPQLQDAAAYVAGTTPVTLAFTGINSAGDQTVFVDNITLNTGSFANNSFETPVLTGGGNAYSYNTAGASWTFGGVPGAGTGIARVGSAFNVGAAPDGSQVAFVQNTGSFQQTTNLTSGTTYTLTLRAAQRVTNGGQIIRGTVIINGTTTTLTFTGGPVNGGNIAPTANASAVANYATYTATITVPPAVNVLNSFTAQSQAPVTLATGSTTVTGIDFGYNFSTIVNSNASGQGSLAQFITNANALTNAGLAQTGQLAGREVSIFMIPDGSAHAGQQAGLVSGLTGSAGAARALIQLNSATLPIITDARTRIDGTTQTVNINDSNTGQVGAGGTVGVRAVAFAQFNRPEVELSVNNGLTYALDLEGDSLGVSGLAIHGAVLVAGKTANAINLQIIGNLIGVTALSVTDPGGSAYNPSYGLNVQGAGSYGLVRGNLFGYAGNSGISFSGGANTSGLLIIRNEFVQNGYRQVGGDAMSFGDQANTGPVKIIYNRITTSNSDGVQFDIGRVGIGGINVVRNNTFFDNGNGSTSTVRAQLEGAAILYLQRGGRTGANADSISFNAISQSQASGIVIGYGQRNIIISRNSTFGNGTSRNSATGGNLGIDLISQSNYFVGAANTLGNGNGAADYGNGDGVTPNGGTVNNAFGNGGMNYPIFTTTRYNSSTNITVAGYIGSTAGQTAFANATIEIYFANELDGNNNGPTTTTDNPVQNLQHGEGQTYLTTITADANGNFSTSITAPTGIVFNTTGQILTATAYLSGSGTSEFGPNSPLTTLTVSGYVYEDVNYGGGAGRGRATLSAGAVSRPNATVELYSAGNALLASTTTDSNGQYSFNTAPGDYKVRTVMQTVTSSRPNSTATVPVAVQTYVRNDPNRVGGENPSATADSPAASAANASSVTISFVALNPSGLDNTAFIDKVEILSNGVALSTNPLNNSDFETPGTGGGFLLGPSTAGWSFQAISGNSYDGITGNSGAFAPSAPSGIQVGFLQIAGGSGAGGTFGSFEQAIQLSAGTYSVRFLTAQRSNNGRVNNLTISIRLNGVEIGQVTPSSGTYVPFTSTPFSVSGANQATLAGNSQVAVTVATASITDADFGYSFDVVTNTNDSGMGSFRQFLANSNALGGESTLAQVYTNGSGVTTALTPGKESSVFMVPGPAAVPGLRSGLPNLLTNGVAVFTPNTATNGAFIVTDANTIIDGTTQSLGSNTNAATLGAGGTVGATGAVLAQVNGPEVQIVGTPGTANSTYGLTLAGTGDGVKGIAILGFGNSSAANTLNVNGANIYVTGGATSGITISGNVIGTAATTFPTNGTDPNTNATRSTGNGILLGNLTVGVSVTGTITNNLIGYNANSGIQDLASSSTGGLVISGNEIRSNGLLSATADGIFLGTAGGTVQVNLITANKGSGVDFNGSAGGLLVTGNTISSNGTTGGAETSGIRAYGIGNTISLNSITNNIGNGVIVLPGTNTANVAGSTILTQNSITTNGKLGIDLLNTGDSETVGTVTLNDFGDVDGRKNSTTAVGGNGLVNFPVIRQVRVNGSNLLVEGYARPGAKVELFAVGTADATGFGEGATYLSSAVEGSSDDSNSQTGTYAGNVNGRNQGTDNTNLFVFTIPLSSLPAGFTVTPGTTVISATATLASVGTSEFSGVVTVSSGPLPVELAEFIVKAVQQDASLAWTTASEKNNDHFDVERSLNGAEYTKFNEVKGQGSRSTPTAYALTDAGIGTKANGTVYYRLKQVDADGTISYSPVRTVYFTNTMKPAIMLFPNPATTGTQLDLTALPVGIYQVSVIDVTGRVLLRQVLTAGAVHLLGLNTIASGTYVVLVRGDNGGQVVNLTKRLVKE